MTKVLALVLLTAFVGCNFEQPVEPSRSLSVAATVYPVPVMDGDGLYGGGSNTPPAFHAQAGLLVASQIPQSGAVLVSLGESITLSTFDAWRDSADTDAIMVQGARGGEIAAKWVNPHGRGWIRMRDSLAVRGVTYSDVDVVWMSVTGSQTEATTADTLDMIMANIRSILPNARMVFLTNRPYGGYREAGTAEPGAWREGDVVRGFILRHLGETTPWVGWVGDVWANGLVPRSDGLVWVRSDYKTDGLHYSPSGKRKIGGLVRRQFEESPFTEWYDP